MTATSTLTETPTRAMNRRSGTTKRLWKTGAASGVAAALATTALAAVAQAMDVSLEVGGKSIPLIGFAQLTVVAALIGTILAVVLARRARNPHRTFVTTTVTLTVLSIIPDVLADASTGTRITLALTHVIAAAIIIPALASRVSD